MRTMTETAGKNGDTEGGTCPSANPLASHGYGFLQPPREETRRDRQILYGH